MNSPDSPLASVVASVQDLAMAIDTVISSC